MDLHTANFPEQKHGEQNHLRLDGMFIAGKGIYQEIRQGINQQKAGQQKPSLLVIPQGEPQTREGKGRWKNEHEMTGDHQVISGNNVFLRRSDPEVKNAFERKGEKLSRVGLDEFAELLLLLVHESDFAQLLKSAHSVGIVARMLAARPQAVGLVIVRRVHLEGKIVANKNKLAKDIIVA